jgi:hypothetical protein
VSQRAIAWRHGARDFTEALFDLLIAATCRMEDELIDAPASTHAPAPRGAA